MSENSYYTEYTKHLPEWTCAESRGELTRWTVTVPRAIALLPNEGAVDAIVDAHNKRQIPPLIRDESGQIVPLKAGMVTGGPGLRRVLKVEFEYLNEHETVAHVSCLAGRTKEQLIEAKTQESSLYHQEVWATITRLADSAMTSREVDRTMSWVRSYVGKAWKLSKLASFDFRLVDEQGCLLNKGQCDLRPPTDTAAPPKDEDLVTWQAGEHLDDVLDRGAIRVRERVRAAMCPTAAATSPAANVSAMSREDMVQHYRAMVRCAAVNKMASDVGLRLDVVVPIRVPKEALLKEDIGDVLCRVFVGDDLLGEFRRGERERGNLVDVVDVFEPNGYAFGPGTVHNWPLYFADGTCVGSKLKDWAYKVASDGEAFEKQHGSGYRGRARFETERRTVRVEFIKGGVRECTVSYEGAHPIYFRSTKKDSGGEVAEVAFRFDKATE